MSTLQVEIPTRRGKAVEGKIIDPATEDSIITMSLKLSIEKNSKHYSKYHTMKFRQYMLNEDPMGGGAPMGDPMGGGMGGDPMGGMGAPMGGDPMGGGMGDPMGGMGGPPMGGDPMGGEQEPPPVPQFADVWDVLDSILNHKPLEQEEKLQQQQQQQAEQPPQDPMGGCIAPPPGGDMGMGDPMGGMGDPMGGMGDPMGGGQLMQ